MKFFLDLKPSITPGPANGGSGGKLDRQKQLYHATATTAYVPGSG